VGNTSTFTYLDVAMLLARGLALWRSISAVATTDLVLGSRQVSAALSTATSSEESLEEIRARIFGNHIGNGLRSGRKVLRKNLIGDKVSSYYLKPLSEHDPMFVDTDIERCESVCLEWRPFTFF